MNKRIVIFIVVSIILASALYFGMRLGDEQIEGQRKYEECQKINSCEKYKCLADLSAYYVSRINYKQDYQNCLLEEGLKK